MRGGVAEAMLCLILKQFDWELSVRQPRLAAMTRAVQSAEKF
jgi:hypothetical protein